MKITRDNINSYNVSNRKNTIILKKGITEIADCAFEDCKDVETIYLPETLKRIGHNAFKNCNNLKYINIPSRVSFIGADAFNGCINLRSLNFGQYLKTLGENAFAKSGIEAITLPLDTEIVDGMAFCDAKHLRSITFVKTGLEDRRFPNLSEVDWYYNPEISIYEETDEFPQSVNGVILDYTDAEYDDVYEEDIIGMVYIPDDVMCLPEDAYYIDENSISQGRKDVGCPYLYISSSVQLIHPLAFKNFSGTFIIEKDYENKFRSILPKCNKNQEIITI